MAKTLAENSGQSRARCQARPRALKEAGINVQIPNRRWKFITPASGQGSSLPKGSTGGSPGVYSFPFYLNWISTGAGWRFSDIIVVQKTFRLLTAAGARNSRHVLKSGPKRPLP